MHEPGLMEDDGAQPDAARGLWGDRLFALTKYLAIAGGLMFVSLVAMSLISIIGRKLFLAPVPGDIEMMQMGTAVGSAAMLAYCEMTRHHLRVDFFTAKLSDKNKHRLDAFAHVLIGLVGLLMAWRTGVAAASLKEAGETSMMLSWPVWPAVALLVPSFVVLALAGFYNAGQYWSAAVAEEVTA
jgi:TRAP-type C4-dicarboxylate transport system permease small subunit